MFCTGPTRAAKAGQKSLLAREAQPTNQGRTPIQSWAHRSYKLSEGSKAMSDL
jgi:hypothetical protein